MGIFKKVKGSHGMTGSGVGRPKAMGVTGPGGKFVGTTIPMDGDRTSITDKEEVGEVGSKKVPKDVGMKPHKMGGMSRKGSGNVGPGGYKGTK